MRSTHDGGDGGSGPDGDEAIIGARPPQIVNSSLIIIYPVIEDCVRSVPGIRKSTEIRALEQK